MDLLKYVSNKRNTGLLLLGKPGLSMKEDALDLARHLLSVSELDNHPDFVFVQSDAQIKVEDVLPLIERSTVAPAIAGKVVAIIDGMERLTISAQNKLLILLESNPYTFVIGIAYGGGVIDTIKSRMRIVEYRSLSREEFVYKSGLSYVEGNIMYSVTNGCVSILGEFESEKKMFLSLHDIISSEKELHQILSVLHLVKEKDSLSVCKDKRLMLAVIRVLQYSFHENMLSLFQNSSYKEAWKCLETEDILYEHEMRCSDASYSAADFFNLIMNCIEINAKKGG